MKIAFIIVLFQTLLFGFFQKGEVVAVKDGKVTITIGKVAKGTSGYVVHTLAPNQTTIVNGLVVVAYDEKKGQATAKILPFTLFENSNLPKGKWQAQKGDLALLAFGYNRALLVAPSEEIYYQLKKALKQEVFAHPDLFATFLSYQGHPSPLQKDFVKFSQDLSLGLLFFFIEQKFYTVDSQSFTILDIQDAPLKYSKAKLPFYSRVEKIEANWFGEGSDEIEDYASYYYKLLLQNNKANKELIEAIKTSQNPKVQELLKDTQ